MKNILSILLVALTLAIFWPLLGYPFISLDDYVYVASNPQVQQGLSAQSIGWAFSTFYYGHWIPLTWLSHILDWQLFAANAAGHHAINLFLHVCNSLLVFGMLRYLSRSNWLAWLVAAIFAIHPEHVEAVAWISSRKDMLSSFFALLSLYSYSRYARESNKTFYFFSFLAFMLGLLSKPSILSLPLLMLLLDFWPLERFCSLSSAQTAPPQTGCLLKLKEFLKNYKGIVLEKIPFFLLSAVFAYITELAQAGRRTLACYDEISFLNRVGTACFYFLSYLKRTFWPFDLALMYPHPQAALSPSVMTLCALALVAVCCVAVFYCRRWPALFLGWFWFLFSLLPYVQIKQVGLQSMADRWMYLPLFGLAILPASLLYQLAQRGAKSKIGAQIISLFILSVCAVLSMNQVALWQSTTKLYEDSVAKWPQSYLAQQSLAGNVINTLGDWERARQGFIESLAIYPENPQAFGEFVRLLDQKGRVAEAADYIADAASLDALSARSHLDRGMILYLIASYKPARDALYRKIGKDAAQLCLEQLELAAAEKPVCGEAFNQLGLAMLNQQEYARAKEYFERAVTRGPDVASYNENLGAAYFYLDDLQSAENSYKRALLLSPGSDSVYRNYAALAAKKGDSAHMIEYFNMSLAINPNRGDVRLQLAEAYFGMSDANNCLAQLESAKISENLEWRKQKDRGACLALKGDYEKAVQAFEASLQKKPQQADVIFNLASIKFALGAKDEAKALALRSLELAPQMKEARALLEELDK